jgi:SAM-dependent MidA family methyltransferase
MRPTDEESRRIILGHDEHGYYVAAKLFTREKDFALKPALRTAFRQVVPISSYALPVVA